MEDLFEEDLEDEIQEDCISPNPDVFSYFTLASANEQKQHGRFTVDAVMSYLLVLVVLFIQFTLLACVSDKVIAKNLKWQHGIMSTGKDWNLIGKREGCVDGKSLCLNYNGTYSCAPPSVQLIGRWDELDVDRDGVWTRLEAMHSHDDLQCRFGVDAIEVFDVLVGLLKERGKHIWLHHDVRDAKAIPKAYFTYIMGDVAMCGYRNADMCGNLMKRGFFDAAIIHGNAPRVGDTPMAALEYCRGLLDRGGLCEKFLPSTYATWKIESVQECKDPEYAQFVYKDPNSGVAKSLLEVDYDAREDYEVAQTPVFITYKICIIFIWLILIVSQLRELSKTMTWVCAIQMQKTKVSKERQEEVKMAIQASVHKGRSELKNTEIHEHVSWSHCWALTAVTVVRIAMLCFLCYVGLTFLGTQTDYVGLLMDGIALLFIIEVEEIIYERVLRQEARTSWEERESVPVKKVGPGFLARRPDVTDMLWFFAVLAAAIAFQLYYTHALVKPLYNALECTCLSQGEHCYEAQYFSKSFWDNYWKTDVPNARQGIDNLMSGLPLNDVRRSVPEIAAKSSSLLSQASHVARTATKNLLQGHLRP